MYLAHPKYNIAFQWRVKPQKRRLEFSFSIHQAARIKFFALEYRNLSTICREINLKFLRLSRLRDYWML